MIGASAGGRESAFQRIVELVVLAVFTCAGLTGAAWLHSKATAPPPHSHFLGEIDVDVSHSVDMQPSVKSNLSIRMGFGLTDGPTLEASRLLDRVLADKLTVFIEGRSPPSLAGREITVKISGDAKLVKPDFTGRVDNMPGRIEVGTDDQGSQTITFHVPPTPARGGYLVISGSAQMVGRLGEISGGLAEINFPSCAADSTTFTSCEIDGGYLVPGESVLYSTPSLVDSGRLAWESEPTDEYLISIDPPTVRLTADYLTRSRDYHVYLSGAVLGFTAGAILEFLLHLIALGAVPARRSGRHGETAEQGARPPTTVSKPPHQARDFAPGERWALWRAAHDSLQRGPQRPDG
jgi:hypothetical protein